MNHPWRLAVAVIVVGMALADALATSTHERVAFWLIAMFAMVGASLRFYRPSFTARRVEWLTCMVWLTGCFLFLYSVVWVTATAVRFEWLPHRVALYPFSLTATWPEFIVVWCVGAFLMWLCRE